MARVMPRVGASAKVMSTDGLDELIGLLRGQRRMVVGPTVRDGVITHAEIESVAELPIGWREEQDGGTYRLVPSDTGEVFAFSSPATAWKRFLYPERTLLVTARREGSSVTVIEPDPAPVPVAFFGIRSCDLAALGVLDRVFLDPAATDPTYAANRSDVFVVAAGCAHPGNTCFCASMGTGPAPGPGYDLRIIELYDEARHDFLVEAGTARGAAALAELPGRDAEPADHDVAAGVYDRSVSSMGRRLRPEDPPRAAERPTHPRWDEVASRCLACGNCTMVCPTCFCGTTEDTTDLTGTEAQRWRVWDSCFTLDFSHMHGGSVRTTTASRYRQWLLHKLVTWHDQFDTSGCVGCGRCITWCPVGIDLTEEVAALAAPQGEEP